MPPKTHAILSASSSHRWMSCTPSARLEQEFDDQESAAAAEGTAAHALAEHKIRKALKLRSRKPVSKFDCDEMDAYTDAYRDFVLERLEVARQECADPLILIEQKLDFSCWVPDGFGMWKSPKAGLRWSRHRTSAAPSTLPMPTLILLKSKEDSFYEYQSH